ncbi:tyrosine-type recombinase/integrase [Marinobacter orientalis]|uniref:DUF4102 domain-containing protein n=1 Tax=Marinobacter orientalis TaxID=1928859 RepID=A0A7Y0NIQ3_9GAMM|nr:integrase arm-type DNA-binding domain-containing protein [Marinobacter orientalis]NMT62195.1 DUF4102 domain-containing protein [Marinobacter orientalis]
MPKVVVEMGALQVKRLGHGTVKKPGGKNEVGAPCTALHAVGGVSGLYLYCRPPGENQISGARSWILRTMVGARRIDLGLGGFPEVTLAQARDKAREIKEKIRFEGYDPIAARRAARSALIAEQTRQKTFEDVARAYYQKKCFEFSGAQAKKQSRRLEQYLFEYCGPVIGKLLMADLEARHVIQVIEPIWFTRHSTAERIRAVIETVCDLVEGEGILKNNRNPARWKNNLDRHLPKPETVHTEEHQPTVGYKNLPRFWDLLLARDTIPAKALAFQILTAARPGEVRLTPSCLVRKTGAHRRQGCLASATPAEWCDFRESSGALPILGFAILCLLVGAIMVNSHFVLKLSLAFGRVLSKIIGLVAFSDV